MIIFKPLSKQKKWILFGYFLISGILFLVDPERIIFPFYITLLDILYLFVLLILLVNIRYIRVLILCFMGYLVCQILFDIHFGGLHWGFYSIGLLFYFFGVSRGLIISFHLMLYLTISVLLFFDKKKVFPNSNEQVLDS